MLGLSEVRTYLLPVIATASLLMLGPGSCRSADPLDGRVHILARGPTLISTVSTLGFRSEVEITNERSSTIYLVSCPFALQKFSAGAWAESILPTCTLEVQTPVAIAPGEIYRTVASIESLRSDTRLRPLQALPAEFRILFTIYGAYDPGAGSGLQFSELLSEELRVSNTFTLSGF